MAVILDDRLNCSETEELKQSLSSLAEFPVSERSHCQVLLKGFLNIRNNPPSIGLLALATLSYRLPCFICVIINYNNSICILL